VRTLVTVFLLADRKMQVSPWMDNGTADSYVKKHPSVNRLKILTDAASGKYTLYGYYLKLIISLSKGLEYLHSRGIVHGDLRAVSQCSVVNIYN